MAYTKINFQSWLEVKEALEQGEKTRCFNVRNDGIEIMENGFIALEGPHLPEKRLWFGKGKVENGYLVEINFDGNMIKIKIK